MKNITMKKNLLLLLFIMVTAISSAQTTIWEDDFDDANVSDWTLLDRDEDGVNWITHKNVIIDETGEALADGDLNVLGSYLMNLDPPYDTTIRATDNWAITPIIDLSQHAGKKIELILRAQPMVVDSNQNLFVYASTSTDPDTFELLSTVTLQRQNMDVDAFQDYTVDISQFAGEAIVYIALGNTTDTSGNFFGLEIDKVTITAGGNLGLGDNELDKNASFLKQNPVAENLELQLGNQYEADKTFFQIYNEGGSLVKQAIYNNENIAVGDLSQGLYFLLLTNNTNSETIKFIKK